MKKVLLTVVLAILIMNTIISAQELIVVVVPFEVKDGFSLNDADTITHLFLLEIAKNKNLTVLDRSNSFFIELEKQNDFELSNYSSPEKVIEIGRALNANAVVMGQMRMLGDQRIITARIIDLSERQSQILAASPILQISNVVEVLEKLPAFTADIVNNLPKPPLENPFIGRWRSTVTSNNETLICILNFNSNGSIIIERYDTNIVSRRLGGMSHANSVRRGRGNGSYSFREEGNRIVIDISLSVSNVSREFSAISARGSFNQTNPNQFSVNSMACEYFNYDKRISDHYKIFNRL